MVEITNLELLIKLIRFRTVNKVEINKAIDFIHGYLLENGIVAKIHENLGYKILLAEVGNGSKEVVLNGHIDVVDGKKNQFEPMEKDGKLFGRGSYDMLGSLAVFINLLIRIKQEDLNIKVSLMIVPTEETNGEIGTLYLVERGFGGDFAICGEPTDLCISKKSKGAIQIEASIKGKSCHGSMPWKGVNPILKAIKLNEKMQELNFLKTYDDELGLSSASINYIKTENVINKVPDLAVLGIDIRYVDGMARDKIVEELKTVYDEFKILSESVLVHVDDENFYLKKLHEVSKTKYQNSKIIVMNGTADTRYFYSHGIPAVEFGVVGAGHHSDNEYIEIHSLKIYEEIILNFLLSF